MRCVYCMWQLVFTDIINNKTEILHWHGRLNLIFMIDCRHLIMYRLTFITFYSCYMPFLFYSSIYISYSAHIYMHMHSLFYSYIFTKSSDSLNLHIQIWGYLLLIRYLERIADISKSIEFSLFDYWYSHFFYSCHFLWFQTYGTHYLFYSFLYLLSCVVFHMLYCSVIMSL